MSKCSQVPKIFLRISHVDSYVHPISNSGAGRLQGVVSYHRGSMCTFFGPQDLIAPCIADPLSQVYRDVNS